jgi:ribose 5-phosphate isomerase B
MKIVIGCDHAGLKLKRYIMDSLGGSLDFIDVGTYDESPVDYPDYAEKVAKMILDGEADKGILICGTGIGMCITANKFKGIYAALVYSDETARLAKSHNNANVLCLGGRSMDFDDAVRWIGLWLGEDFEGGRHLRRLDKIRSIEGRLCDR